MLLKNCGILFVLIVITPNVLATNDFICTNGNRISISLICNGIADCIDGSDETKELCYHIICPQGMYRCHYGACIRDVKECDGRNECFDGSDESQCGQAVGSCEKHEFRCKSGNQCIPVKQLCDGKEHCLDGSDESTDTCEEFPCPEDIAFHCTHGGGCIHLNARCDGHKDCLDGSDESEDLCRNLKCKGPMCYKLLRQVHCPALDISRMELNCHHKTLGTIPCDNPVPLSTVVTYKCKPYFVPINSKHKLNTHAVCQLNGKWNKEILKCRPACGSLGIDAAVSLVVKGWNTKQDTVYPWHGTLYVQEANVWEMWCGGTLITEKLLLTAGHCTWQLLPTNIKVALAKYYSDFHKHQQKTQFRNVKRIVTQPLYQDKIGNYGSDLSLLVLDKPVTLSMHIQPACIDWESRDIKHHLIEHAIGLTVGMGVTENDTFSEVLRAVYLPVVSNEQCLKEQEEDFKKYVTFTVFCAGWRNGTGVCNGDSGGGLLFPKVNDKSRWVLQGVVSISPRKRGTSLCDPDYYTVFTRVGSYLDWLKEIIISVHKIV